jgi:hypothetical protein
MSEGDRRAGSLDDRTYEQLLHSAATHRQRLVVRLSGEAGLRPAEMCRVRLEDVTALVEGGRVHYLLSVRDEAGERRRTAYLPAGLKRELERYANGESLSAGTPVFDVTPRRLQMLVAEVTGSAAEATGRPRLGDVSTGDLRRYYGRRLLERGVDPAVVMGVGGWRRLDGLAPEGSTTDRRAVVEAFERAGSDGDDRFRAALERLEHAVVLLGTDGVVEHVNRRFETATGLEAAEVVGRPVTELVELSSREWTELWETATCGDTWVGTTRWTTGPEESVETRTSLAAVGTAGGSAEAFVLSLLPDRTTVRAADGDERLRTVQAAVAEVNASVAGADTREEVLEAACDGLTSAFEFAWGCEATPGGADEPLAWAGLDAERLGRLSAPDDGGTRPADRAVATGEVGTTTVEKRDGDVRWLVAVPLVDGETVEGALVVGSDRSLGECERAALANLGHRVAGALATLEWKRLLLADAVLELEFQTDDRESFFVAASTDLDCRLRVEGLVPLGGQALLYYVTVSGVSPDRALAYASDALESARLIADHREECLLEVTAEGDLLAATLVDQGANVRELVAEEGLASITCEVAPSMDVRSVAERLCEATPSAKLVAKRETESPVRTATEYQRSLEERLTDKQRSVMQAAYHAGYFDWPRGSTAEELADSIGVSSPTLHNHLRRAQRKLLAAFFDDGPER